MKEGKTCPKCGQFKSWDSYHKNSYSSDGFQVYCKLCRKQQQDNRKQHKKEYDALRYSKIKDDRRMWRRKHYQDNKEYYKCYNTSYYIKNKITINDCNNSYRRSPALYNEEIIGKLAVDDFPRLASDNKYVEIKCRYCGKYFTPNNGELQRRISVLNGVSSNTSGYFYCSTHCKRVCPVYNVKKWPRGFKVTTSREVQPELRQLVLKRDNYTCQKCYKNNIELHCHHITGILQNPIESADMDNCITLCKKCHKEIHKNKGCRYYDLRCNRS